jgi:hypothetical protein
MSKAHDDNNNPPTPSEFQARDIIIDKALIPYFIAPTPEVDPGPSRHVETCQNR